LLGGEKEYGELRRALRTIDGTFVSIERELRREGKREGGRVIWLRDPSILDFLRGFLAVNERLVDLIIADLTFFEQIVVLRSELEVLNSEQLLRCVVAGEQLLHSNDPTLTRYPTAAGALWGRGSRPNLDRRAELLWHMVQELEPSDRSAGEAALGDVLRQVQPLWRQGQGDKGAAVRLSRSLRVSSPLSSDATLELVTDLRDWLIADLDSLEDWLKIVRLEVSWPELFRSPASTMQDLRPEFQRFVRDQEDWLLHDCENPDEIEEFLREFHEVADLFEEDVWSLVERAQEREQELRESEPDPDYERERDYDVSDVVVESDEIESMFESLRHE
jgi:hypothetical protein